MSDKPDNWRDYLPPIELPKRGTFEVRVDEIPTTIPDAARIAALESEVKALKERIEALERGHDPRCYPR
jgi:hypothetical protein